MNEKTIHAKLIAKQEDSMGYTNYVFRDVDNVEERIYISCTRLPNWNCSNIELGDVGYLTTREVKAGEDTWYDGENNNPYKYNAVYFHLFIDDPKKNAKDYYYYL